MQGCKGKAQWHLQHDRRKAIALALAMAEEHDVIIIAGKGHEQEQIIGTEKHPFCDVSVVQELISSS